MMFNTYQQEDSKPSMCDERFDDVNEDFTSEVDLYNTTQQSPISSQWSINRPQTGSSKQIRKIKQVNRRKANQYFPDDYNYILQKIVTKDGLIDQCFGQNTQKNESQKNIKKLIKQMKQLNIK